ncbi:MAG: hypothetical protein ABUL41_02065, partial [Chitinophagaceae bacterium]
MKKHKDQSQSLDKGELQKQLKRKSSELERLSRELEIEAALEKVRTIALSMKAPDDMLRVCKIISLQLQSLGVKEIRNVQTAIFYESRGTYMNYEYYAKHKKTFITETLYTNHKVAKAFATKMLKGKGEFFITHIKGKKVKDWIAYQKTTNVFIDRFLEKASSLSYYWFSLGPVALGISSYVPLNKDELNLFKRFLNVFELAYRRYLDIEKAETQAREAKIEAALEKVRGRTMGMQKSEELGEVAVLLYRQFLSLGVNSVLNCGYVEVDEINNMQRGWMTKTDGSPSESFNLPLTGDPVFRDRYNSWKRKEAVFHQIIGSDRLKKHIEFNRSTLGSKEEAELVVTKFPDPTIFYCGNFSNGYLHVITGTLLSKDEENLLERFTRVFEQTYTRFLDLQKAEEQAREAQIELGLERVRARAMAMQKSDELKELIGTVFTELTKLDLVLTRCVILIFDPKTNGSTWWMANSEDASNPIGLFVKHHELPPYLAYIKAWKDRKNKFQYILEGDDKKGWDDFIFLETELSLLPDFVIAGMKAPDRVYLSSSFNNFGCLTLASLKPLSNEHLDILLRFAKVFDLTYTRFNDLKQAEAQARESQIQLALERVRARTMAMQHSDELREAAALLFQQAKALGVPAYSCGYNIWEKNDKTFTSWMSTQDGSIINGVPNIPLTEDANFIRYVESKQKDEQFFVLELRDDRMQEHYEYLKTIPAFKVYFDYAVSVGFDLPETQIHHLANFSQGNLLFITLEPCPEFHDVFKRFAAVFEQTYTRFLDLQKAEAQARESQIEAALEKVRSRTMAMQKSEDLNKAASDMFKQIQVLGMQPWACGFNIFDKDEKAVTQYMSLADGGISPPFRTPLTEDPFFINIYEARQRKEDLLVMESSGKGLEETYRYMFDLPGSKEIFGDLENSGFEMPKFQITHCAYFSQGYLVFITYEHVPESHDIFKRFAKVFEQTYTRFLDLQKAEAQARESQIEAALEKVRSRSMGMQKSEELKEVIRVVYNQFIHLNIHIEHTGFLIDYKGRDDMHIWLADQHLAPSEVTIPYFDSPPNNSIKEAKEKGQDFFTYHLTFEEKNKFYRDLFKFVPGVPEETLEYYFNCPGLAGSGVLLENIGLYIENFSGIPYSDEENKILMRFGKVFQQTYTRFLDLQKAEAQARESQIQLALERVRARTMAMQRSEELPETSLVLYEQFKQLGEPAEQLTIGIVHEENNVIEISATLHGCVLNKIYWHSIDEPFMMNKVYQAWKTRQKTLIVELKGDQLNGYNKFRNELTKSEMFPTDFDDEHRRIVYAAFFSKGMLAFAANEPRPPQSLELLERFASVFDLTYTRFFDLQKAEAQAREAQIEASLERVRSKTMAMHNSQDVGETVATMIDQ